MLLVLLGLLAGLSLAELYTLQQRSIAKHKRRADKFANTLPPEKQEEFKDKQTKIEAEQNAAEPALLVQHGGKDAGTVSGSGKISLEQGDIEKAKAKDTQVLNTPPVPPPLPQAPTPGQPPAKLDSKTAEAHTEHAKSVFEEITKFDKKKLKAAKSVTPPVPSDDIPEAMAQRGVAPEKLAAELNEKVPEHQKSFAESLAQAVAARRHKEKQD